MILGSYSIIHVNKKTRILIVDDEPDITFALKTMFQDYDGFAAAIVVVVDTFNNPVEALSNFKADKYDLLICYASNYKTLMIK